MQLKQIAEGLKGRGSEYLSKFDKFDTMYVGALEAVDSIEEPRHDT